MPTGRYFEHWCEYQQEAREMTADDIDPEIERSEEYGSRIIHSMETGEQRRMNINVRNDAGAIANLGNDTASRFPVSSTARGPPCSVGELLPSWWRSTGRTPASSASRCRRPSTTTRDALRQAVKLDPLTSAACTLDEIDEMVDDLLSANAEYLPDELVEETRTASSPA